MRKVMLMLTLFIGVTIVGAASASACGSETCEYPPDTTAPPTTEAPTTEAPTTEAPTTTAPPLRVELTASISGNCNTASLLVSNPGDVSVTFRVAGTQHTITPGGLTSINLTPVPNKPNAYFYGGIVISNRPITVVATLDASVHEDGLGDIIVNQDCTPASVTPPPAPSTSTPAPVAPPAPPSLAITGAARTFALTLLGAALVLAGIGVVSSERLVRRVRR